MAKYAVVARKMTVVAMSKYISVLVVFRSACNEETCPCSDIMLSVCDVTVVCSWEICVFWELIVSFCVATVAVRLETCTRNESTVCSDAARFALREAMVSFCDVMV